MVDVVVLGEERVAEDPRFGQRVEVVREVVNIFERLELCLGERVVIRNPGPGMRPGDAPIVSAPTDTQPSLAATS